MEQDQHAHTHTGTVDPTDVGTGCFDDSLEMVTEESPVMFQTEYMDTHTSDREGSSSSEDVTYDPDWMTSPTGSVSSSPHRSIRTHDSVTSEQPFYLFPPDDVENSETSPQLNTFHQQEPTEAQEESTPMQRVSSTSLTDNISSTKKCSRPKLDAVEQNKITLGLNTTRRDSYMLLYGRQQDRPNDGGGVTPVSKGKSPNKNECQTQTDPEEEQPPESWGQPRSMDNVTTEIKCASSGKEEDPDEVLTGTASSASLLVSSTSSVLPPIVEPMGEELERNLDKRSTDHGSPSRCDGYLAHMEKQKQQGAKVTYKAYSLKDYKQLNSEIKLQGLGPDYKAIEGTKMRRQRLYSNVVREHNKKISRIPFLPEKHQDGSHKKVPRMKALEYAKTVPKPSVQPPSRQRVQQRSDGGGSPSLEGLDVVWSDKLEALRKRHEEEKKAVALFRK